MDSILDWALKYAEMGFAVFPLKGKEPITYNGLHNASKDRRQIENWWNKFPDANIGIATGKVSGGLVVIDLDKHGDVDGEESLDDWQCENGPFPDTWTVITGSLGRHIFVKSTSEIRNGANVLGQDTGVDIRGDGGYVVAPPSIHPDTGRRYEWEYSWEDCDIAEISNDATLEFFFADIKRSKGNGAQSLDVPEQINEGGRNDMLFRIACSLQAKGLSDQAIEAAVFGENTTKCNPPLSDKEVHQIINSALRNKKGLSEEYQKKKEEAESKKTDAGATETQPQPKSYTFEPLRKATDLMQENLQELRVLVGVGEETPLLVEGTCILSAKSKIGKSWFALELCDAVSKGNDFVGYKTEKCHALYLDLETKKNLKQKRLNKLEAAVGKIGDGFLIQDTACRMDEGFEEQLEYYMKQDPEIGIVVIDVFQRILKPKKSAENDYEYFYEKIGKLNKLSEKYHISIILVTHDRKTFDPSDPFSNILGSTALQGATDQMIVMYKMKFNDNVTNIVAKGRTIDGLVELKAFFKDSVWTKTELSGNADGYLDSEIRKAVVALMQDRTQWGGRCFQLINDCKAEGIKIPDEAKEIGGFLCSNVDNFLSVDNIHVKRIKNGTGGSSYTFTRTEPEVDGEWLSTDEPDMFS